MVLRLMLVFVKRGTDGRDELEEIATEALKNLLCVLLNTKLLGFVSPKGGSSGSSVQGDVPVWWQMTWDCIEVFLPGFSEEFSKSMMPKGEDDILEGLPQTAATPTPLERAQTAPPGVSAAPTVAPEVPVRSA